MTAIWIQPRTLDEALDELASDDATVFAGGVSLVLLMNLGLFEPAKLVSLARVAELDTVTVDVDDLILGAMCTHAALAGDPTLRRAYPAAAEMFGRIGNVRVRSRGTLGGNLAHADPAQDPPVMLAALEAAAIVAGPHGTREIPVEAVADGPYSPVLEADEIVTAVRVPLHREPTACSYLKFLPGTQDDYATVSIGAQIRFDRQEVVREAKLVAGAVGTTILVLESANDLLVGKELQPDVLEALHTAVRDEVSPRSDRRGSADYKREMAGVMAQRAAVACLSSQRRSGDGP